MLSQDSTSTDTGTTHEDGKQDIQTNGPLEWRAHVEWSLDNVEKFAAELEPHEWESALWPFVRLVKGHPAFIALTGEEALVMVESALFECGCTETDQVHQHWKDVENEFSAWRGGDTNFDDDEEVRMEFIHEFETVRFPIGSGPLDIALTRADREPLPLTGGTFGYRHFISLAFWLQTTIRDGPILLPCAELARRLGCSLMCVSRYRAAAERDGYLTLVKKHNKEAGLATQFRFDLDRFPTLS